MKTILPTNAATETTLAQRFPAALGPQPAAQSLSIVFATDSDELPTIEASSGIKVSFIARQVAVSATIPILAAALGSNYPGRTLLTIENTGNNVIFLGDDQVSSNGLHVAFIVKIGQQMSFQVSDAINLYMVGGPGASVAQVAEWK